MKDTIKIVKYQNEVNNLTQIDTSILDGHLSYSDQAIIGAFRSSDAKIRAGSWHTLLSGFLGGLFVSIGYIAALFAIQGITTPGIKLLVFGIVFPVGLLLVTFLGGGIYTSHCVGFINVVTGNANGWKFTRNLFLVFGGNLFGCLFASVLIYFGSVFGKITTLDLNSFPGQVMYMIEHKIGSIGTALAHGENVTSSAMATTFLNAFFSGIFCNILVAATLYVTYSSKNSAASILCIFFVLLAFCISGYQHVVANAFIFWMNVLLVGNPLAADVNLPGVSVGYFAAFNLLPAFIGNFLGGALIIPTLAYFLAHRKVAAAAVKLKKSNYEYKIKFLQIKLGFAEIINNHFTLNQEKFNAAISGITVAPKRKFLDYLRRKQQK